MAKWKCTVCGYIYDEAVGDVNAGAAAGTKFVDLAADWTCPVCGAPKDAFEIVPEPVSDPKPGRRIDSDSGEGEAGPEAGTTVSEVLIAELAKWGVDLVFGLPGTSSLGLVDAIRKNPSIRYIVVRHEENAAMAASAYNKLTGKIAGCLTIAGPGATNLTTGLYDAKEDHASVISLNGQVEAQYTGPGGIQEIDQDAFFRPITVYNNTVYEKNVAVLLLDRALKYATVSHGVAQLSVPNDIQKQPLDAQSCIREACIRSPEIIPTDEAMKRAADAINAAAKPVILAGWGAYGYGADVLALAERLRAPVLTTFRAKGIVPEDNPWVIGILGNVGSPQARNLATSADLIITLGVGFSKFTNVPAGKAMVQLDTDPIKLGKNEHTIPLWGNARHVLPRLLPLVRERPAGNARAEIASMKNAWNAQRDSEADSSALPLRPPFIMKVLSETIPEDAVISVDVGENQWWFGRNFRLKRQRFCMSGYLATMGFGFPGAIAAKIAYPDKPVFCITGDGGFSMAMGDFVTAVKYKLPMVVIVLDNRQLGMIQVEQMQEHYPNYATDLTNPDFARYAEVCGGAGLRVEKPEDLKPAVVKAMGMDRPVIVDVSTDPKRF